MDFLALAKQRYSVRKYLDKPIENEKLMKILEAGRVAPTAANYQPQRILAITKKEGLEKIAKAANIFGAPTALVVCADTDAVWTRSYDKKKVGDIDASIVTTHMMLQATELGIGSLWICKFEPTVLRREFDIPTNLDPVNILAIGYADCQPAPPERHDKLRLPLQQTIFFDGF